MDEGREEGEEASKRKLCLRKESLVEMTGWDIRELMGGCTTVTTQQCCGGSLGTQGTNCCPPFN